jgi:cytochrome c oxidase subunit 1
MATAVTEERKNYLNAEYGIRSWLFTTDHKRIAMLYLLSITAFFFIGGFYALLIRLELLTPGGDLLSADMYNKVFTMHGQVMIFFFLIPSIPAVLGNFLIPIMIGAKDLAFPRINLLSWYIYIVAGILYIHCIVTGGVDTGWTFYPTFSTQFSNTKVIEAGLAIFVSGFSSILTGLNFVVTVHRMRAPGMTWSRLPLFVWSHYAVGYAGNRDHIGAGRPRTGPEPGDLRPHARRRSGAVPAPVLVLLAPRGLHHDSAVDGSDQRNRPLLLAQANFRV